MSRLALGLLGLVGTCLVACGAAAPAAVTPAAAAPTTAHPATVAAANNAGAPAPQNAIRELPDVAKELEAARVTGTIALLDTQDGVLSCSDVKRCQTPVTPASTFKIPHSMVALETGVVEGPDTILPWDKQQHWNDNWNRDLPFRDAFRLSCLPCYRAIARKVGPAAEQDWVNKLSYGNRDASGAREIFWVDGGLRISPAEQIDFLRRFDQNQLPISERTADIVRDIMTLDVTETYILRGKTGTTVPPDEKSLLAWFVGWLEVGPRRVYFATLLDGQGPGVDAQQVRRPLTERVLHAKGLM